MSSRYRHDRSADFKPANMMVYFPLAPLTTIEREQLCKLKQYYELNPTTTLFLCHVAEKLYLKELNEYFRKLLGNGYGNPRNIENACIKYLPQNRKLATAAANSQNMRALRILFINALLTGVEHAKYDFTTNS